MAAAATIGGNGVSTSEMCLSATACMLCVSCFLSESFNIDFSLHLVHCRVPSRYIRTCLSTGCRCDLLSIYISDAGLGGTAAWRKIELEREGGHDGLDGSAP